MSTSIIPLSELRQGAILPAAIYDARNSQLLLLSSGIKLTQEKIASLEKRGVSKIVIDSKFAGSIQGAASGNSATASRYVSTERRKRSPRENQVLNELRLQKSNPTVSLSRILKKPATPLYDRQMENNINFAHKKHAQYLGQFLTELCAESSSTVRCDPLSEIANESVCLMLGDIDLFVKLAIESGQTEKENGHCLKVAKLAMSIATILEYNKDDICHLGMGCMMSRIGIGEDIQQLINLPRRFTPLECLEMKKHASRKMRLLEQISGLSPTSQQVAWLIHERWNGSGYPRGRASHQIPPLARIASVADTYVAMTSDRPFQQATQPYKAIEAILDETRRGLFEPNAVRGLLRTISLFPLGSYIELSNKAYAVTIRNHIDHYDRPTVKVVCDSFGLPIQQTVIVLFEQQELQITRSLCSNEVENLLKKRAQHNKVLDSTMNHSEESTLV